MENNTMEKEEMEEEKIEKEETEKEVKVVPWYNADEFRKVYECVFSPDLTHKNWAVDTMTVWKTRVDPCLPAAIECTLLLTTTLIQDALFIANRTPTRQHFIELQYSCAIVRFVNLTVSVHEKEYSINTNKKQTISQMAKLLGIPTFIVDLRNQISHTTLTPPLPHMRLAAEAALDYVKKSYWDKEAPRVRNHIKKRPNRTEYKRAISNYLEAKLKVVLFDENKLVANIGDENDEKDSNNDDDVMESIKRVFAGERGTKRKLNDKSIVEYMDEKKVTYKETNEQKIARKKHEKKMAKIEMAKIEMANLKRKKKLLSDLKKSLEVLDKLLGKNKRMFVDAVTELFVPKDRNMMYFVDRDTYELFTDVLDEHEDEENPSSTPKESCIPDIPRLHEVLWLPIIQKLNLKDVVPLFLEKLLLSQGSRSVIGQKLVLAWVIKILKVFCKEGRDSLTEDDHRLINIFKKRGIVATWERLFMSALENPCTYTPLVLPWITRHVTADKSILDRCMTLLAIYLCQTVDVKNMQQTNRFFTLEDLKKAKRIQEARLKYLNKEVEECIFKKVTDDRFVNVPIGYRFPVDKTQKTVEEDNSEMCNEVQDFKIKYIIGDSDSEDIDLDEYYNQFKQSDDELLPEKYMDEINEMKTLLYKPK